MRRALAVAVAFAALAPAAQARNPITGTLDKPGFTVVAMARDGRVTLSTAKANGDFRIVPPASRVTLHLRTKAGQYGGPVIIAGAGKSLVMGVHHGVDLGAVHVAHGFARVKKAPAKAKQDTSFKARARGGTPLGAGVFGRVKATATAGVTDAGADADSDGVPNALDVDDDGDLILDDADEAAPTGASIGQAVVFSTLSAPLETSLNVDAGAGVITSALDVLLKASLVLAFPLPASGTLELNCGGLSYCSKGGTGKVLGGAAFPACCDSDNDNQGAMKPAADAATRAFLLSPNAANRDIAAGDLLVERTKSRAWAGTTNVVFATTPAAAAWTDGTSVGPVTYPSSATAPGAAGNPLTLHARADGHVVLQLAVWRPQRRAFPGEADAFVDLGRLRYSIIVDNAPESASGGGAAAPGTGPGACSLGSYTEADASLTGTGPAAHGYLLDAADDLTADPGRTLVFSVDLTKCLGDAAVTWKPGQILTAALRAADAGQGFAEQLLTLRLAPATT